MPPEPCKRCSADLEPSRNAALTCLCAACFAKADDHLVLVRVTLRRWNIIQWWMSPSARDARELVRANSSAGVPPGQISAALRTAKARTVLIERVRDRQILIGYRKPLALGAAVAEPWAALSVRIRGEPRLVGYELTGSRAREEA